MASKRITKKDIMLLLDDFESCIRTNMQQLIFDSTAKSIQSDGPELIWVTAQLSAIEAIKHNINEFEKDV